jgi:hypothetical protein
VSWNAYLYGAGNPLRYVDPSGEASVSTMIDQAAEGCGALSCMGWAVLYGAYHVATGGFAAIHDPARDAYDEGEIGLSEYALNTAGGLGLTALNMATGRLAGSAIAATTSTTARVAGASAVGSLAAGANDMAAQGLHVGTGIQEDWDRERTGHAFLAGAVVGGGVAVVPNVARALRSRPVRTSESSELSGSVVLEPITVTARAEVGGRASSSVGSGGRSNLGAENRVTPYGTTLSDEVAALRRMSAANNSAEGSIANARISLKPYVVSGDVDGLIANLDVSTGGRPTGFWSGNLGAAMNQANSSGVALLETTRGGSIANGWTFLNKKFDWANGGEKFWGGLSSKYATGATGDVYVWQAPDRAISSSGVLNWKGGYVWQNYEQPVVTQLQNMGTVGNINYRLVEPTISNSPLRWH